MLIQKLTDYCDYNFKKCLDCGEKCNHPTGKCSGSCADCLKEIQYHRTDGRTEYDCRNMLRYYTCHTAWKRCSEILYALETLDLKKYPKFNILSVGCGASPDLAAFLEIATGREVNYLGVDIASKWKEIHNFIEWETCGKNNIEVSFERQNIYELLAKPNAITSPYNTCNVIIMQYMIAGHIHSDRADKIESLFDEVIDKLIFKKPSDSPLLLIINDIDHKSWICDYFNLFTRKLRKRGLSFTACKRHFEPRNEGENAGSKLYKSRSNKFLSLIPAEQREKYNAHAPCSAAQLIIEVM